ncbi:TetR/AcrR family transcriptional regulator [Mycolicibacterium mucogenicum]|nr:TetR/AcrR family transcriptional regulator [Mycolicibacterium mucogenicum]
MTDVIDVTDGRLARGNRTREQLLAAALEKFGERGFHATTMKDIAQQAGVSPPSIYNHFDSKESILYASLMWGLTRFHRVVVEPDDVHDAPVARLEGIVRRHAAYQIHYARRVRFADRLLESVAAGELLTDSRRGSVLGLQGDYRALLDTIIQDMSHERSVASPPARVYTSAILTMCDRAPQWPVRRLPEEAGQIEDDIWFFVQGMLGIR